MGIRVLRRDFWVWDPPWKRNSLHFLLVGGNKEWFGGISLMGYDMLYWWYDYRWMTNYQLGGIRNILHIPCSFGLIKSNSRGTFSGVWIFCIPLTESFSRTINEARPTFCRRRYSIHACPCSTVSTTRLFRAPHAVDTATSYLSGIVPKLPRRPYQ